MIDLARIRQERTWKRVLIESLANAPDLFLMFYGLKMLLTLHGQMLLSVREKVYSSLRLAPASGALAAAVGLQYFAFGLFIYLSDGRPPPEDRRWPWRAGRALLRWGSLAVALFCFLLADKMVTGRGLDLTGLPATLLVKTAGFIAGIMISLSFLGAMFQREQVKRELFARGYKPRHIWWRPAAYWMWRYWFSWWFPTGFRVIYSDPAGLVHKGYCFVYRSFREDRRWGNRRVRWIADTVTGRLPAPEAWADDEILRPKLESGNE